jgi:hypothetical protein
MKKLLITVLAGLMMASLSFAASSRAEIKDEAARLSKEIASKPKTDIDVELKSLISKLGKNSFGEAESSKILEGLKLAFKDNEKVIEAITVFSKAKSSSVAEVKATMEHVDYTLKKMTEINISPKVAEENIAPLLGAAKLAVTVMDNEGASKVTKQMGDMNWSLRAKANAKTSDKIDLDEAGFLAFVRQALEQKGEGNKSITRASDLGPKEAELREEYKKWKENCRNTAM